jgi:hypothetical protein
MTLEGSYRRLLWAYPRWYRRERGVELLSTLLDAAAPGQRRPTGREAVDLVLGGLRCRFAVPRGPGYRVVGALFVVIAGVAGFAGAGSAYPPSTVDLSRATAVADTAMGAAPPTGMAKLDVPAMIMVPPIRDHARRAGPEPAPEYAEAIYAVSADRLDAEVDLARRRLVEAGWVVAPVSRAPGETAFWATRDGLSVRIAAIPPAGGTPPLMLVDVHAGQPAAMTFVALAGLLSGAVAGRLLAARALRVFRVASTRRRGVAFVAGVPGLLLAGGVTAMATLTVVGLALYGWSPYDARAAGAVFTAGGPLTVLGIAGLLVAVLALVRHPRGTAPVEDRGLDLWRHGSRTLAAAHLTFAVGSLLVLVAYVVRLSTVGGDRDGMVGGAYDWKDTVPFGTSSYNPLLWVFAIAGLLFLVGFLFSPALLLVSVPVLVLGRSRLRVGTWRLLLVAAMSALVLLPLRLNPVGFDAASWFLD